MAAKVKKETAPVGPLWLEAATQIIDGNKWIRGEGKAHKPRYMIIGDKPSIDDHKAHRIFSGEAGRLLHSALYKAGLSDTDGFFTNAVKYLPPNKRNVAAADLKLCKPMLMEEIRRVEPDIVVCLGATALKMVCDKQYSLSTVRGEHVPFTTEDGRPVQLFVTYSPSFIAHDPSAETQFRKDIMALSGLIGGKEREVAVTNYRVIDTCAGLIDFCTDMFKRYERPLLALDMEWHGITWMYPERYIRTVQLCWTPGEAVVINMRDPGGVPAMDDEALAWKIMKSFLEDPRMNLAGHNVISDGEWLAAQGIDIRPRVVFDTMLAEYLINELGPHGLEELTSKYTNLGHYERALYEWKDAHKIECKHGFGHIPNDLLHPYGARDVDATM